MGHGVYICAENVSGLVGFLEIRTFILEDCENQKITDPPPQEIGSHVAQAGFEFPM